MASFSYARHIRAETGQKRSLVASIGEDLTSAAKRTAAPFSGTAARPDRGTNATVPVARWSYQAMQEGDVAFVDATQSSGIKPGYFLQAASMSTLNKLMANEDWLVDDPYKLFVDTPARHSYVCDGTDKKFKRSMATKQFSDSRLEANHPCMRFILEGVVCAKTDMLTAESAVPNSYSMTDLDGAEAVVAVAGQSTLNSYDHGAMSKSRVLDHVYVVLMTQLVRADKHKLQYGLINSLHVWHGHVGKHFGNDSVVLKVWQLGRLIDVNYARDRDAKRLLKLIVAIKPLVARAPSRKGIQSGMVPVDGDQTLEMLKLPTTPKEKAKHFKSRNEQTQAQKDCKSFISSRLFARLAMSPGPTTAQLLEIQTLQSQLGALREQSQLSNEENARLKRIIQRLNSNGSSGNDNAGRITDLERVLADAKSAEDYLQRENIRIAEELEFYYEASQGHEAEIDELEKKLYDARIEIYALKQDIKRLEEELETLRGSPSAEVIALRKELEMTTIVKSNVTAELNALKSSSAGSSSSSGSSAPADNARVEELTRVVSALEEEKKALLQQLQSRQRIEHAEDFGDEGDPEALKIASASFIQVLKYRNKGELSEGEKALSTQATLDFEDKLAELTNNQLDQVDAAATWFTTIDAKGLSSFFIKDEYDKYMDDLVETRMKDRLFLSQNKIKAGDEDKINKIKQLRQVQVELAEQGKADADEKRTMYSYILGYNTPEGAFEWKTNLENNKVEESFLSALTLKIEKLKSKGNDPEKRINKLTQERRTAKELNVAQEAQRLRDVEMYAKRAAEMRGHMRVYNTWKGVWQALYNGNANDAPPEYKKAWKNNRDILQFLAINRDDAVKNLNLDALVSSQLKRREEVRGLMYLSHLASKDFSKLIEKLEELDKKSPRPGPYELILLDSDFAVPAWATTYKPDANFEPGTESDLTEKTDDKRTVPTKEEPKERTNERKKQRDITKWALDNYFLEKQKKTTVMPKDEWTEDDIDETHRKSFKRVDGKWKRVEKQSGDSGQNEPTPPMGGGLPPPPVLGGGPMAPPPPQPPVLGGGPLPPPPPPNPPKK